MAAELDAKVAGILAEYDARSETERTAHEAGWDADTRRDQLLLRIGPDTGRLINLLIKGAAARHILEIGTSYGYSTVWLAEAARATGGRVTTLDLAKYKQDYARGMLERAGLAACVEWRCGEALELLKTIAGPIDFVLIDLWKDLYIPSFDLVAPKLAPGALVVADNMRYPSYSRPDAEAYRAHVRRAAGMQSVLLEVGSGIEVTRYEP
ncbi:MAG: O-methyltransferase [Steroidobacteraceae bacterium]